jgi:hypothetical protein
MLLYVTNIHNLTHLKPALKNFKRTLFVLKRTVNAFNDLFGSSIFHQFTIKIEAELVACREFLVFYLRTQLQRDSCDIGTSVVPFVLDDRYTAKLHRNIVGRNLRRIQVRQCKFVPLK